MVRLGWDFELRLQALGLDRAGEVEELVVAERLPVGQIGCPLELLCGTAFENLHAAVDLEGVAGGVVLWVQRGLLGLQCFAFLGATLRSAKTLRRSIAPE